MSLLFTIWITVDTIIVLFVQSFQYEMGKDDFPLLPNSSLGLGLGVDFTFSNNNNKNKNNKNPHLILDKREGKRGLKFGKQT